MIPQSILDATAPILPQDFERLVLNQDNYYTPNRVRDEMCYHILWPVFAAARARTWPVLVIDEFSVDGGIVPDKIAEFAGYAGFRGTIVLNHGLRQYMIGDGVVVEIDTKAGVVDSRFKVGSVKLVSVDNDESRAVTGTARSTLSIEKTGGAIEQGVSLDGRGFHVPRSMEEAPMAFNWNREIASGKLEPTAVRSVKFLSEDRFRIDTKLPKSDLVRHEEYAQRTDGTIQVLRHWSNDDENLAVTYQYDAQNRLRREHVPGAYTTNIRYTDHGRRVTVDVVQAAKPDRTVTSFQYDAPPAHLYQSGARYVRYEMREFDGTKTVIRQRRRTRKNGDICLTEQLGDHRTVAVYRNGRLIERTLYDGRRSIWYSELHGRLRTITYTQDLETALGRRLNRDSLLFDEQGRIVRWEIGNDADGPMQPIVHIHYGNVMSATLDGKHCRCAYRFVE